MYSVLPLPPFWKKCFDPILQQEYYVYTLENIEFFEHPSYFYLRRQIRNFKTNKQEYLEKN